MYDLTKSLLDSRRKRAPVALEVLSALSVLLHEQRTAQHTVPGAAEEERGLHGLAEWPQAVHFSA